MIGVATLRFSVSNFIEFTWTFLLPELTEKKISTASRRVNENVHKFNCRVLYFFFNIFLLLRKGDSRIYKMCIRYLIPMQLPHVHILSHTCRSLLSAKNGREKTDLYYGNYNFSGRVFRSMRKLRVRRCDKIDEDLRLASI